MSLFRLIRRKSGQIVLFLFSVILFYFLIVRLTTGSERELTVQCEKENNCPALLLFSNSRGALPEPNSVISRPTYDKLSHQGIPTLENSHNGNLMHQHNNKNDRKLGDAARNVEKEDTSNKLCPTVPSLQGYLPISVESHKFQAVDKQAQPQTYVFSAFYATQSSSVNIIAISSNYMFSSEITKYYCQFWTNESNSSPSVSWTEATFTVNPENHSRRYAAAFYTCYAPNGRIPEVVALVTERCQTPTNLLKIIQSSPPDFTPEHLRASQELGKENGAGRNDIKTATERDATTTSKPVVNFTVCVTPFNLHYNDVHQLVEMIETNRMFGAERFVFYNHSTGPDVEQYLKSYISDGIVEVIPWHIPVIVDQWPPPNPPVQPEIHYFGQLAALNDCLYRSSGSTRFIVFTDMDEILVPRAQKSWIELLDSVNGKWAERNSNRSGVKIPGAYIVRNTFFRHDWGNDNKMASDKLVSRLRLRTLLTTTRESDIQPWYSRSKHIVWARMIQMVGVHNIIRFIDDRKVEPLLVQTTDALIHHYRPSMWPDDPASPMGRIRDRRMHAFQDDIISRTQARHRKVERLRQIRT